MPLHVLFDILVIFPRTTKQENSGFINTLNEKVYIIVLLKRRFLYAIPLFHHTRAYSEFAPVLLLLT